MSQRIGSFTTALQMGVASPSNLPCGSVVQGSTVNVDPEVERHHLYLKLEGVLVAEEVTVLMEHLPPVGWAEVATKQDLQHVESVLSADMATLEANLRGAMSDLGAGLFREQRNQMFALVSFQTALMAVGLAVLRLV
ncbi:MAG: hypothetical protein WBA45_11515 [Microthrixaceae bacterium]